MIVHFSSLYTIISSFLNIASRVSVYLMDSLIVFRIPLAYRVYTTIIIIVVCISRNHYQILWCNVRHILSLYKRQIKISISVSPNTSSITSLTLSHSSWSRPQPISGIASLWILKVFALLSHIIESLIQGIICRLVETTLLLCLVLFAFITLLNIFML